jgi:hypothetical protein
LEQRGKANGSILSVGSQTESTEDNVNGNGNGNLCSAKAPCIIYVLVNIQSNTQVSALENGVLATPPFSKFCSFILYIFPAKQNRTPLYSSHLNVLMPSIKDHAIKNASSQMPDP